MSDCGHGHVYARADGIKARCGGPGVCPMCSVDLAAYDALMRPPLAAVAPVVAPVVALKSGSDWSQHLRALADQVDRGEVAGLVIAYLEHPAGSVSSYAYRFCTRTYELEVTLSTLLHRRAVDRMVSPALR